MGYSELLQQLRDLAGQLGLRVTTYGHQRFAAARYPLVRLRLQGGGVVLITAGFHGDEPAGPETLRRHLPEIVEQCRRRGLGLVVYPCINPSGFERGQRYNEENQAGNNDFLRYLLPSGKLVGDLFGQRRFLAWVWASDLEQVQLPKETATLHRDLRRLESQGVWAQTVAAIDLHQDAFLPGRGTYAYAFGDLHRYTHILEGLPREVAILSHTRIGSGYGIALDSRGGVVAGDHFPGRDAPSTNEDGLLVRHDASISDLMHRLGAPHSVAVETTSAVDLAVACRVNLHWILSLIDLAASAAPPLTPYRQTAGLCGPASLKIVARHFGIDRTERQLAALCGADPQEGTTASALVGAAERIGLQAWIRDEAELRELRPILDSGGAAIVNWFSFSGNEGGGHYSVVQGIDDDTILLQDPELGGLRSMKRRAFETVWFDFEADAPSSESLVLRRMIVFSR